MKTTLPKRKTSPWPRPKERIFANGKAHFDHMLKDIAQATTTIDLETYIFQRDSIGELITSALIDACRRGVRVRILVDGAGTPAWTATYAKPLEHAGAETRIYHPFPWQLWNYSRSIIKLPFLLKWTYLFLKANKRNHRKTCIIDNQITYIGSMNITKAHMPYENDGSNWRDTSVRIQQPELSSLTKAFEAAWSHRSIQERIQDIFHHVRRNPVIRLNYSWIRRRILYKNLLRKVSHCKKRIWITNAYFVPDNFLLRRIKEAARRGVDVRILLPKKSDVLMMPWASSTFYYSLLKNGVRIFEYMPSNLHAKTLILDNWMLVGSSNLNHRSLLHDLEIDVNVRRFSSKQQLISLFEEDLKHAKEIFIDDLGTHRPWRQRFLGRIVLYLKYWI